MHDMDTQILIFVQKYTKLYEKSEMKLCQDCGIHYKGT